MKIGIVTAGGVDRSGTERVTPCLLSLIERLVRQGHEVHVFALAQEPAPGHWPLLGAAVHNAGRRPRAVGTLRMLMAEHRKAPFDILHAFSAGSPGTAGALAALILRVPLVLTMPGGDMADLPAIGFGQRRSLAGRLRLRLATACAGAVTVQSGPMRDQAERLGIAARRVPLGVALDRWPPVPPRRRRRGDPLRLLHVASLNPVKDQATLLEAAAELDSQGLDFTLDIVGIDTLDGAVQRRARALGLDSRVRFHGFQPQPAVRAGFEGADLLVMSSIHEAGPVVLAEAALAGVPTVGTAVGHIAEWDGEAALAVPVGDHRALASAIASLAADEDRRLHLAEAAGQRALRECADQTAGEFDALYRALAPASGRERFEPAGEKRWSRLAKSERSG